MDSRTQKHNQHLIDLQQLRSFCPEGTVIFREKDARDCAYIIETGEVEISVQKDGRKVTLVRLGEGEVFGETALLGTGERTATAVALQDTHVFRIFPGVLRDRIAQLDPIVGLLMSLLINRYRQWRYVSPAMAAEASAQPPVTSTKFSMFGKDDDGFLQALDRQKQVALKELQMAQEIVDAVDRDELGPFLQPIVSLADGKLCGFEALIRWQSPVKGMISPMDFIPVAERTHIVAQLDMMMLKKACKLVGDMQAAAGGASLGRKLYISVNLSGVHFDAADFSSRIVEIVKESGVDPAQIVLEITESALMGDPATAEKVLETLKSHGLTIALDDFGTGYSSLSYLHRFPIDILKIDRSFVVDIHNNKGKSHDVVGAIAALAKTFGLSVIAEGIEHEEDIGKLSALGCDRGQGYFFGKPLPVEQARAFVKESVAKHG